MANQVASSNRARYVAAILLVGCSIVVTEAAISLDLTPLFLMVPWTVWSLIAAVAIAFSVGGTWIWGKRFRFSIKTVLLLVLIVALPASRFANEMRYESRRASTQKNSLEAIYALNPKQVTLGGRYTDGRNDHKIQLWLGRLLAKLLDPNELPHEIAYVNHVDFSGTNVSDKDMARVAGLKSIELLDLSRTAVTDSGLAYLSKLTSLGELRLKGTAVSDEAVENIKTDFPNVTVVQ